MEKIDFLEKKLYTFLGCWGDIMKNIKFNKNVLMVGKYAILKNGLAKVKGLRILDTGNKYGCMTTKACFYDEKMSDEDIRDLFLKHRKMAAKDTNYAFDPYKFYMPSQDGEGKAVELTEEMIEAYKDGWDLDIKGDILIVTNKTPGVVAGFPVADCPVVIASDLKNGVTATAHCSAAMIDKYLPIRTIEALQSKYNSKKEDIYVHIGAHASSDWTYDRRPDFMTESFWDRTGALRQVKDDKYKIDLDKALLYQLNPLEYESFIINTIDTLTDPNYYSNSVYNNGKGPKKKDGRHFEGAYYQKVKRL